MEKRYGIDPHAQYGADGKLPGPTKEQQDIARAMADAYAGLTNPVMPTTPFEPRNLPQSPGGQPEQN